MVIETNNLVKKYGKFTAVDNVSLSIKKGEIYGFLGLNGAGKTTTIKALLGLLWPTSGLVSICGQKINRNKIGPWEKTGSLVEMPAAYPELSVWQNLEIFRRLRGLSANPDPVLSIMDKLKLSRYKDKKAGQLSLGNQQRLGLARAMMHNPELLILDEPANGLDPAGIVEIRNLFSDLSQNHGVTIFVSSHHLAEISKTASRIGIIHEGRMIQEIQSVDLEKHRRRHLVVKVRATNSAINTLTSAGYSCEAGDNHDIKIIDEKALEKPDEVARLLVMAENSPMELFSAGEDLESYFLRIIQSEKNPRVYDPKNGETS